MDVVLVINQTEMPTLLFLPLWTNHGPRQRDTANKAIGGCMQRFRNVTSAINLLSLGELWYRVVV